MIRSLEDAWEWYLAVRTLAYDMRHLAGKCDRPEWEAVLGRDNRLRHRSAAELRDMSQTVLDDLDDLAVLVLFSVFEATVRARAGADVDREMALITHVALKQAVRELKEAIASGSFAKVTAAFQKMDNDLTAQVNQVRKFRNWVAHGRRDAPENNVTPAGAFERLGRYLDLLTASQPDGATSLPPTTVPSQSAQPLEPEKPSEA
jgi:hypothetical protein